MIPNPPSLAILSACLHLDRGNREPRFLHEKKIDWSRVIALANVNLLGPTLHARICARQWREHIPHEAIEYLALLHRLNRVRNAALRRQAIEIIRAFNESGITPLILKGGVVLFDSPYPRRAWSMRMMRDLDFMVRRDDLPLAVGILSRLRYAALNRYPTGHHAFAEFTRPNAPGAVDLHVELVDAAYILPADEVWSVATPIRIQGLTAVMLPPTERMLHHLLHAQLHYLWDFYRGDLRLDQLYEFATMTANFGSQVDWKGMVRRLEKYRLVTPLHSYLLSAMEIFGPPWPLAATPRRAARFHCRRCRWQLRWPGLRLIAVPWGNLRAAFAWHRMKTRYGMQGSLLLWWARHACQFVKRTSMRAALGRVFRYEQ